jgi:hypothetical protein
MWHHRASPIRYFRYFSMPSLLVSSKVRNESSATVLCCLLSSTSDVIVLPNSLSSGILLSSDFGPRRVVALHRQSKVDPALVLELRYP